MTALAIRSLVAEDVEVIASAFRELSWNKPVVQYQCYLAEQGSGQRVVLVAHLDGCFAGYLTVVWESCYTPFAQESIPEIMDLNVLPRFRRQGVATALMEAAEKTIRERSPIAGIGVGLDADYGAAQRLYVLRGYVPDGRGLMANGCPILYGDSVSVDDKLMLYFTKRLRGVERNAA
jgi:GNAT superfamily N-acetyltransferase